VDVGLDHPLDPQAPLGGLLQVDADVTAPINDDRRPKRRLPISPGSCL
jgi:hypothetical protein